jgi:hypothetical protein
MSICGESKQYFDVRLRTDSRSEVLESIVQVSHS